MLLSLWPGYFLPKFMGLIVIFFLLVSSFLSQSIKVLAADRRTKKCGLDGPDIRFPFRLIQDQKLQQVNVGFELLCKDNSTVLHFPFYGNLVVKSISYEQRRLNILDPNSCVHGVFLNLNLYLTPFRYYYVLKNYTYLNCSSRLSPPLTDIPCLSGSGHHVYTVDPSSPVPASCKLVTTTAIPFAYSPYLSDNSFGLGLTWDLPECEEHKGEYPTSFCKARYAVLAVGMSLIAVVALVTAKIRYTQKIFSEKQKSGFLLDLFTHHCYTYQVQDSVMKQDDVEESSQATHNAEMPCESSEDLAVMESNSDRKQLYVHQYQV